MVAPAVLFNADAKSKRPISAIHPGEKRVDHNDKVLTVRQVEQHNRDARRRSARLARHAQLSTTAIYVDAMVPRSRRL
jgi:hypothetical protein